jgi:glyoxylase-like metal-dependent hydrolase (beta-lactamase superfamily II)
LIIDTGLDRKECLETMHSVLQELGVELDQTDILITPLHADHFGLASKLATDSSNIIFSRLEKDWFRSTEGFGAKTSYAFENGVPENDIAVVFDKHPGIKHVSDYNPEWNVLQDNDEIAVGDYNFRCVETPGHTVGHICLYEPTKKLLVAGDLILADITANIQCWSDSLNPLKNYLASLDKVSKLEIDLVLPWYRCLIDNHKARINELKEHYQRRLNEVLVILNKHPQNAFQVAAQIT